jgi:hypothetical protein
MTKQHSSQPQIHASGFEFLQALKQNNNRDWFNAHKMHFQKELNKVELFAEGLLRELNTHDVIETLPERKACTGFTGIPGSRPIKHLTKQTGVAISKGPPNTEGVDIIFI